MVRLNRAISLSHVLGAAAALREVDALAESLERYHLFHATRAEMLRQLGRAAEAHLADERALQLTRNPAERSLLSERLKLDRPLGNGARGTMRTRSGGPHNIAIRDVEPGSSFILESDGVPATRLLFRCEVAASSDGTRICQAVTLQGPLSFLFGPMMGGRIAQSFGPLLEGLAAEAERS